MSIKLKDTIYDLISNSDKLDGKDSSEFALAHSHPYLPYYTLDSGSCSSFEEGLTALKALDATAGNPNNHSAFLYIKSVGTPFQIQFSDSSEMYLYKRYYTSGAWSAWSKMKAGYADSAGSIAWGNITGKPSTYPHAEHSHPYLPLSGGTLTGPLTIEPNAKDSLNIGNGVGQFRFQNTGTADGSYSSIYAYQRGQLIFTDTSISSLKFVQYGVSTHRTIYHSGNLTKLSQLTNDSGFITGSYLPLAGGNMAKSGYITFTSPASTSVTDSTAFAITYGKIQAAAPISIIADTDGTSTEYIIMTSGYTAANATKANGLAVGKNELTWKNSAILTAGNYSSTCDSRYVTKAGDNTMTGTLTMPLSGLNVGNNCSTDTNIYRAFRAYNSNLSTSYAGGNTIYICAGHSASVGNAAEIGFTYASAASTSNATSMGFNAGNRLKLYYNGGSGVGIAKICSSISGGTEYTLLHEGNYSTWAAPKSHTHDDRYFTESEINTKLGNYLPLAGGTMTGTLTIPLSKLVIGGTGGDTATTRVLMAYGTEANKYINLGYSASAGNCAELAWGYSGSASTSNYTYLGFYGGYGLYVYYNNNVLRLGTASTYKTVCFTDHTHSNYAASDHSHSYLPLTGGTVTGDITVSKSNPYVRFTHSGTAKGYVGYYSGNSYIELYNSVGKNGVFVKDNSLIQMLCSNLHIGPNILTDDTEIISARYIRCVGKSGSSYINWGYSDTAGNIGELAFNYSSAASTSNSVYIGFHSKVCIQCYYSGVVNIPGALQIGGETITFTT